MKFAVFSANGSRRSHQKNSTQSVLSFLVPVTGIEPVRCCHHGILSPGRLPVPPHRHVVVARPGYARFAYSAKLTFRVGSSSSPRKLRFRGGPYLGCFWLAALFARLRFSRRYVATSAFGSAHRKRHAFTFCAVAPLPRENSVFAGAPFWFRGGPFGAAYCSVLHMPKRDYGGSGTPIHYIREITRCQP